MVETDPREHISQQKVSGFVYFSSMIWFVLAATGAYLLGSIPSSVWLGRALKGVDVREHGSGNAGATNAFRVLGKPIGTAVLLIDMCKGYLAVQLAFLQHMFLPGTENWMLLRIGLGLLAVTGHIFPVFALYQYKIIPFKLTIFRFAQMSLV